MIYTAGHALIHRFPSRPCFAFFGHTVVAWYASMRPSDRAIL